MIHVALCDDMKEFCDSYRDLLKTYDDIELVGIANDSEGCKRLVENVQIDVLLLDICMEKKTSGINIIADLKELQPEMKIIMLTGYFSEDLVFTAFSNGASDYIEKSLNFEEVVLSIRNAYENKQHLRPDISKILVEKTKQMNESHKSILFMVNNLIKLSSGEFEVLHDAYYGLTYKEIANKKFVEEVTVRTLVSRILHKFECKSMEELLKQMHDVNLFELLDK